MHLSSQLLLSPAQQLFLESWSEGDSSVRGTYNPLQFVLKLSPEIHRALSVVNSGAYERRQLEWETIQAFSTSLHETVHWWQHIGSTSGFLFSIAGPIQFHGNYGYMKEFLRLVGAKMPIARITNSRKRLSALPDEAAKLCNIIVNNYQDIEFYYHYQSSPSNFKEMSKSFYFECLGHSFDIAYGNAITTLDSVFVDSDTVLPRTDSFVEIHGRRKEQKVMGYYYGSPILLPPFGTQYIFEAQARFVQLQYLFFASGGKFNFDEARAAGMLSELYVHAFEVYLNLTKQDYPRYLDDHAIGLFLLICDIAINPTAGFPIAYNARNDTIRDNTPGIRFIRICEFVRSNIQEIVSVLSSYDKDAYVKAADIICDGLNIDSPMKATSVINGWREDKSIVNLMKEHEKFEYDGRNMSIKFLFAHFIEFCSNKLARPDFFCWPAHWMVGDRAGKASQSLFYTHQAPFVNDENDDGIHARIRLGISDEVLLKTMNDFYSSILIYEMSRQWAVGNNWFKYDQEWLSTKHEYTDMKKWVDTEFKNTFGISTECFEYLRPLE